jgi:hypothetical protein
MRDPVTYLFWHTLIQEDAHFASQVVGDNEIRSAISDEVSGREKVGILAYA